MALKATIFKAELRIADMDRNYYHDHALTIARHPQLDCTIQDGQIWMADAEHTVEVDLAPMNER